MSMPMVILIMRVSFFWDHIFETMWQQATFMNWGTSCLCMKNWHIKPQCIQCSGRFGPVHVILPWATSVFLPFLRCLYSWALSVSVQINTLMSPGLMITFPLIFLMISQPYLIGRTVVEDEDVQSLIPIGVIVATWCSIKSWLWSILELVFY